MKVSNHPELACAHSRWRACYCASLRRAPLGISATGECRGGSGKSNAIIYTVSGLREKKLQLYKETGRTLKYIVLVFGTKAKETSSCCPICSSTSA